MAWVAHVQASWVHGGAAVRLAKVDGGRISEVTNLTFEDHMEGEMSPNAPCIEGPDATSFLQSVMDAAYEYGLRPSKAQDERHMKAHLQDMREISRHLLKMDKQ